MEVYISINGVLRDFIKKFDYHYREYFLEAEEESQETEHFNYSIEYPVRNDNLMNYYKFQSESEYNNFCYIEFALEIFGHSNTSYSRVFDDLNKLIYKYPDINFTLIGLDELGRTKPSTLFFLSKNGYLGNNIKFIKSDDIDKEWKKCNIWITDNEQIINKCPKNKTVIKFTTDYNDHILGKIEINNINKIDELCLKYWEKTTTSTLMRLLKSVARITDLTGLMKRKNHQKEKMVNLY